MKIAVYVLLGLGFSAVLLFNALRVKKGGIAGLLSKTLASVLFFLVGLFALMANKDAPVLFGGLIVGGLLFGIIGDILLDLKVMDTASGKTYFMFGCASFFIGHIFYLSALFLNMPYVLLSVMVPALISPVLGAAIVLLSGKLGMDMNGFRLPCFLYGSILIFFALSSLSTLIISGVSAAMLLLFIGSVMFLISDLVLCLMYFSVKNNDETALIKPQSSPVLVIVNHMTYYAAQYLIALSILFFAF